MFGMSSDEIGNFLIGLSIAITAIWGGMKGKEKLTKTRPETKPETMMEVSGAIVSDKKANEWIAAVNELTEGLKSHGQKLDRNTDACDRISGRMDKTGTSMDNLAKEMEFQNRTASRGGPTQF